MERKKGLGTAHAVVVVVVVVIHGTGKRNKPVAESKEIGHRRSFVHFIRYGQAEHTQNHWNEWMKETGQRHKNPISGGVFIKYKWTRIYEERKLIFSKIATLSRRRAFFLYPKPTQSLNNTLWKRQNEAASPFFQFLFENSELFYADCHFVASFLFTSAYCMSGRKIPILVIIVSFTLELTQTSK